MTIDSHFNKKRIRKEATAFGTSVAGLCSVSFNSGRSFLVSLAVMAAIFPFAAALWLVRLKRISIWNDEMEVSYLLMPFVKRYYRFAEFDYMIVEGEEGEKQKLRLVKDYRRVLTITSTFYDNFDQLRQALRVPVKHQTESTKQKEQIDESRMVRSVFVWWTLLYVLLFSALTLFGAAIPLGEYIETGSVDADTVYFGLGVSLLFAILSAVAFYPYKRITVWHGQIETQRLIWPFRKTRYRLCDFDGCYYVTETGADDRFSPRREARWLMRGGQLALRISEGMYANYEELKNATRTTYLGSMDADYMELINAWRGKEYYNPPMS